MDSGHSHSDDDMVGLEYASRSLTGLIKGRKCWFRLPRKEDRTAILKGLLHNGFLYSRPVQNPSDDCWCLCTVTKAEKYSLPDILSMALICRKDWPLKLLPNGLWDPGPLSREDWEHAGDELMWGNMRESQEQAVLLGLQSLPCSEILSLLRCANAQQSPPLRSMSVDDFLQSGGRRSFSVERCCFPKLPLDLDKDCYSCHGMWGKREKDERNASRWMASVFFFLRSTKVAISQGYCEN